jgi:hypothetical protein
MEVAMTSQPVALRLITDASEARACFNSLVESFAELADAVVPHKAVFRPGSITATTYFFRRHGIWAMPTDGSQLSESKNRFWNSFGLGGSPNSASPKIAVAINHPHSGRSNVSGRFLVAQSRYFIGHTGRIGGGIKNSDASAIERITGRSRTLVEIDGRLQRLAFLSPIEPSAAFIERLALFVRGMSDARERLKAEAN